MTDAANPPAFPRSAYAGSNEPNTPFPHHEQDGLSTRAYFAAHAPITVKDAFDYLRANEPEAVRDYTMLLRTLAQMRLAYAEALMKEGAA